MKQIISVVVGVFFIALIAIPGVVFAVDWVGNCTDNETLFLSADYGYNNTEYNFNRTINCPQGCSEGIGKYGDDCVEPNYIMILWIILGILGLFFILAMIGKGRR